MAQERQEDGADSGAPIHVDSKPSRAARIKKPPFGLKAPQSVAGVPGIPELSSDINVAPAHQPMPAASWWHEAGKSVLTGAVSTCMRGSSNRWLSSIDMKMRSGQRYGGEPCGLTSTVG